MEPRDRILGPIASVNDADAISVNFSELVAKLILSEEWIFESIRLREFPLLIAKFGYDGVKALLRRRDSRTASCPAGHFPWVLTASGVFGCRTIRSTYTAALGRSIRHRG
jgi:hypothetical protein